jgi:hypothetical protein
MAPKSVDLSAGDAKSAADAKNESHNKAHDLIRNSGHRPHAVAAL